MAELTIHQALELAMGHHRAGRLAEAEAIYRQVLAIAPEQPVALNLSGVIALQAGRFEVGIGLIRRALAADPTYAAAYNNLGHAVSDVGDLDEAMDCYRKAIQCNPRMDEAYNNLGVALKDAGLLDESIAMHRRAVEINPAAIISYSNLLYTLYFHEGYDAAAIGREYAEWNRRYIGNFDRVVRAAATEKTLGRRLRVGYVSPNLHHHVVGRFLLPLLREHDRGAVEVFCYAVGEKKDDVTRALQKHTDVWRDAAALSHEQLAETIRNDRIDILVDLCMHMHDNRLLTFARRPAPVQATYLAYCGTTGMNAIQWRISDPYLDPPEVDESVYSEKTARVPQTYWCYEPSDKAGAISPLPAKKNGFITFGCLNNFCKVGTGALAAWAEILRHVPRSRLILHARPGKHRQRVLAALGVEAERVEFVSLVAISAYFDLYGRIDIGLDPFPYAGGTTTCDALWMGVPVVTLAGRTAVGRGGVSILSNVGVPELIGKSAGDYVEIAVALAGNSERLAGYRRGLRERMRASPLMDAPRFARGMEAAYRMMWQTYCEA